MLELFSFHSLVVLIFCLTLLLSCLSLSLSLSESIIQFLITREMSLLLTCIFLFAISRYYVANNTYLLVWKVKLQRIGRRFSFVKSFSFNFCFSRLRMFDTNFVWFPLMTNWMRQVYERGQWCPFRLPTFRLNTDSIFQIHSVKCIG